MADDVDSSMHQYSEVFVLNNKNKALTSLCCSVDGSLKLQSF